VTIETTSTLGQLAQHDPTGVLTPSEAVTKAIHAWVSGLDIAVQGAEFIVDTPACPDSFWPLPADKKVSAIPGKNPKLQLPDESRESYLARRMVAAQTVGSVVRYGLGLGLAPEVALNGIFVIGGRYSMYAEQMVALIKSHGHKHRVIERTAERCVVEVRDRNETDWETFEFTMEAAITAGYVKGKGPNTGKDEWKGNDKYNTDGPGMLYARVSSIACKTKFPDVLRGMVTYEEMQDERARDDDQVRVTRVTAQDIKDRVAPRVEARQPQLDHSVAENAAARVEERLASAPAASAAPVAETGEAINLAQSRKLAGLLRKLDLDLAKEEVAARAVVSFIAERAVEHAKYLTTIEADKVIARLEELAAKDEKKWRAEIRFILTDPQAARAAEQIATTEGDDRG
jgi:hypothetical protein